MPTSIVNEISVLGFELQKGDSIVMLLWGMIQYNNSLSPIFICEYVYLDTVISDPWQVHSIAAHPMLLENFKNTIQQKMNAYKIKN